MASLLRLIVSERTVNARVREIDADGNPNGRESHPQVLETGRHRCYLLRDGQELVIRPDRDST